MVRKKDDFKRSGPKDVSDLWVSRDGCLPGVLACLVKAVYVFASYPSGEHNPCAQEWYRRLNYELVETILEDGQIVGAIFRRSDKEMLPGRAPKVVIAFRGTMRHRNTWKRDLKANVEAVALLKPDGTNRIKVAVEKIQDMISKYGVENVCITGHSLGAAVCLKAGRQIVMQGSLVEAHLFNPPFPAWRSSNPDVNSFHDLVLDELSSHPLVDEQVQHIFDDFEKLKNWIPHLYVHRYDVICSSYLTYFEHRLRKEEEGGSSALASFHSIATALLHLLQRKAEPFHLIPNAHVHVLKKFHWKLKRMHGIRQWWIDNQKFDSETINVQFIDRFFIRTTAR